MDFFTNAVISSIVFSLLGIAILLTVFVVLEKITPENLWKEVIQEKNSAIAILGGSFMIAIAIIIAAAIHG